ncbi:hypothetical protein D9M72_544510 [compost metagenome]
MPILASATSASTSSVSMSAMVTIAPLVSAAAEKGVMLSPTLACLTSTTPSKGARTTVCSTATSAARALAWAEAIDARELLTEARALSKRATSASYWVREMAFGTIRIFERRRFTSASFSSACCSARLACATWTCACACANEAETSLLSSRAMISSFFTCEPSSTPSHSSRPCALDATAALRCGTT